MARPKISRHKVKTSITIDPELFKWVQSKIETREFSSTTHAVERGLYLLKKRNRRYKIVLRSYLL